MDMATRIKERRLAMDYTQEELASKLGLQKSAIAKYENGRVENIKRSIIQKMASILECSPSYLMGWDDSTPPCPNIHPIGRKNYPVLGSVACGQPVYMSEEKEVYVDSTTEVNADFVLIAKGDSMTGARINDGDIVFIHQQSEVENGEIAVVAIDDEATLKRFYRYSDDLIVLRAENPAYKDMEFRPEDHKDVRVLGKAVAFQSDVR